MIGDVASSNRCNYFWLNTLNLEVLQLEPVNAWIALGIGGKI
jgi:hypothetical protein